MSDLASGRAGSGRKDGVTILIRNRNRRAVLPRALHSALGALESLDAAGLAAEVVVVDHASKDGSQKLLRGVQALYGERRSKILCLDEEDGKPWEAGLRASSYKLVCIMDAGNELLPVNLPLFARSASDTGAAMVYGNVLDKRAGAVASIRSSMPVVPGIAKSRHVDGLCIVDADGLERIEVEGDAAFASGSGAEGWGLATHLQDGGEAVVFVPAVLGYRHEGAAGGERGPVGASTRRADAEARDVRRPARIYHPLVGFLDE